MKKSIPDRWHRGKRTPLVTRLVGPGSLRIIVAGALTIGAAVGAAMALAPSPSGTAVLVTTKDLSPGDPVNASSAIMVALPASAVPLNALTEFPAVSDQALRRSVRAHHVFTVEDFVTEADVPPGHARIVIHLPNASPLVLAGHVLDLWGPDQACTNSDGEFRLLAKSVLVEEVNPASSSTFADTDAIEAVVLVPTDVVADVLCATISESLHFVMPSD